MSSVKRLKRYRRYAADCVRQAESEETLDEKTIMLSVTLAWLRLAQQTEAREEMESPSIAPGDFFDERELSF